MMLMTMARMVGVLMGMLVVVAVEGVMSVRRGQAAVRGDLRAGGGDADGVGFACF